MRASARASLPLEVGFVDQPAQQLVEFEEGELRRHLEGMLARPQVRRGYRTRAALS